MAYTLGNKSAKIFVNGQFYFILSSKMWSHVFLEHSVFFERCVRTLTYFCRAMRCISAAYAVMRCLSVCPSRS